MIDYVDVCLEGMRKLNKCRSYDSRLLEPYSKSRMLPLRQPARLRCIIAVIVLASLALEFRPAHYVPLDKIRVCCEQE
jgi:hypothetical protein